MQPIIWFSRQPQSNRYALIICMALSIIVIVIATLYGVFRKPDTWSIQVDITQLAGQSPDAVDRALGRPKYIAHFPADSQQTGVWKPGQQRRYALGNVQAEVWFDGERAARFAFSYLPDSDSPTALVKQLGLTISSPPQVLDDVDAAHGWRNETVNGITFSKIATLKSDYYNGGWTDVVIDIEEPPASSGVGPTPEYRIIKPGDPPSEVEIR